MRKLCTFILAVICITFSAQAWNNYAELMNGDHAAPEPEILLEDQQLRGNYLAQTEVFSTALAETDGKPREIPFWTDVVTSQPEGYVIDADGNVEISTAEGLAWLISTVNGLNGCQPDNFEGRTVKLTANISLNTVEERGFTPIGNRITPFKGTFDGGFYNIDGINVASNDFGDTVFQFDLGMFGYLYNGTVKNVRLNSGWLVGKNRLSEERCEAALVGTSDSLSLVEDCIVKMQVGFLNGGAVVGVNRNSIVRNCAYASKHRLVDVVLNGSGLVMRNLSEGGYADAEVLNCYFCGKIFGSYSAINESGIVCFNETAANNNGKKAIVKNCHAEHLGDLWGENYAAIVAYNSEGSLVEYSYADLRMMDEHNAGLFDINNGIVSNCTDYIPEDGTGLLSEVITIGENSTTELLEALNLWVEAQENPSLYRTWVVGENGIPEFGDFYTSIAENNTSESKAMVYPNPASEIVRIQGVKATDTYIYDILGRLVQTSQGNEIYLKGIANGVYLLKIKADDGTTHHTRVVINK